MGESTPDIITQQRINKKANRGGLLLVGMVCISIGALLPKADKESAASSEIPNAVNTDTLELESEIFMLEEENSVLNDTIDTQKARETLLNMRIDALLESGKSESGTESGKDIGIFIPGGGLLWSLNPQVLAGNLVEEVDDHGNFILDPKFGWEKPEEK